MSLSTALRDAIRHAAEHHGGTQGAQLEALRMIQQEHGWVSDGHLAEAAAVLGVPPGDLESLATFYSLIFRHPVGETVILLCDGASCWMAGSEDVRAALRERLGIDYGETTADGRYTLINICCVGACDRAPAAVVGSDRRLVGPLTPEQALTMIEEAGA